MSTIHSTNQTLDRSSNLANEHLPHPFVGARAYIFRLIGKEAQQLAPLFIALMGCGLILHLLGLLTLQTEREEFHSGILILIPTLLAAGAGPLLVSQEKEQRTLGWLGSLPVPWRTIVLSKLFVSVLALIACWLISFGLAYAFQPSAFRLEPLEEMNWLYWVGNTFFLLVFAFALTWLYPTAFSTLIACLLICSGVAVLSIYEQDFWQKNFDRYTTFPEWLMLNDVIAAVVVSGLAIWFGGRSFIASASSESKSFTWGMSDWRYWYNTRPQPTTQTAASTLIWQIGIQNRMLWVALGLIVLTCVGWLGYKLDYYRSPELMGFSFIVGFLILSWLGASVFGSDAHRDRIQFLAERGVAPGLIWWTRLILPVGLVTVGLVVQIAMMEACFATDRFFEGPEFQWETTALGALAIFAYTQWFSQWSRSTLIVFCLAPAVAFFAVGYGRFANNTLNAAWWLQLTSIAVALIATRVMLCSWMNGRFGIRFWLSHGAMLIVALTVPAVPFLITYATYPAIPSSLRQSWEAEAIRYRNRQFSSTPMVLNAKLKDHSLRTTSQTSRYFSATVDQQLRILEDRLADSNVNIDNALSPLRFALDTADIASLRLNTEKSNEHNRDRYQRSLLIVSSILQRLRNSETLYSQEVADRIEAWLVAELERPNRKQILSPEIYREIVQAFPNHDARDQARRRAIIISWYQLTQGIKSSDFGLSWPAIKPPAVATPWVVADRQPGLAAAALLKHLDPNSTLESVPLPVEISSYWQSASESIRELHPEAIDLDSIWVPGLLWHQEWEDKAQRLSESVK